ncbi:hypothetical protein [Klebsiella pneumoniae]|uniref:hypothetical protein n=1 Tax=Klebsiella pneumoniae TaxID=573 RepID=UPI0039659F6A
MALIARDETGLQETRQACERFGIKTLAISADVVDAGALQRPGIDDIGANSQRFNAKPFTGLSRLL